MKSAALVVSGGSTTSMQTNRDRPWDVEHPSATAVYMRPNRISP